MQLTSYRLCLAWLLLLLLFLLPQCGWGAAPTPTPEPVTLQLINFSLRDAWSAAEKKLLDEFQSQHPSITLERREFNQSPQSYLGLTPAPNLVASGAYSFLSQAIAENLVVDLTDLWAQAGILDTYPAAFQRLSVQNGKQYYLPVGYAWSAIYYNRDLFAQYNLQPPQTWDEFMLLCDTLLANGETPLSLTGDPLLSLLWLDYLDLRINGAQFHRDLVQGNVSYMDDRVRQVVETWSLLLTNGYFVERPTQMDTLESVTALVRNDQGMLGGQKAVMTLTSPPLLGDIPDKFMAELDFFAFPRYDPGVAHSEVLLTLGYMAPARAEHIPDTLTLLGYLGSLEAQTMLAKQLGENASFAPARSDIAFDQLPASLQQGVDIVRNADEVLSPFFLSIPDVMWPSISTATQRFLENPEEIDRFLEDLEAARQAVTK